MSSISPTDDLDVVKRLNLLNIQSKICILLEIPRDVYNMICSEWLMMIDIGKLDIAMSQEKLRPLWLEQLKSKSMELLKKENQFVRFVELFQWIYLRELRMVNLSLAKQHLDAEGKLKFQV